MVRGAGLPAHARRLEGQQERPSRPQPGARVLQGEADLIRLGDVDVEPVDHRHLHREAGRLARVRQDRKYVGPSLGPAEKAAERPRAPLDRVDPARRADQVRDVGGGRAARRTEVEPPIARGREVPGPADLDRRRELAPGRLPLPPEDAAALDPPLAVDGGEAARRPRPPDGAIPAALLPQARLAVASVPDRGRHRRPPPARRSRIRRSRRASSSRALSPGRPARSSRVAMTANDATVRAYAPCRSRGTSSMRAAR